MNFSRLETALQTVGVPIYHYEASKQPDQYIVWAEEGDGGSGHADNSPTTRVITGTVDYYTRTKEGDTNVEAIFEALGAAKMAHKLNSVQYEDDTRFVHYEWVWKWVV